MENLELSEEQATVEQSHEAPLMDKATQDSTELNGTFATAEELLRAYEHLRKDYTRKCQENAKMKEMIEHDNASVAEKTEVVRSISVPPLLGNSAHITQRLAGPRSLRDSDNLAKTFFTGGKS
ncbi:MAG: hypothetical protein FWE31_05245 [Firmicutes bacterium]|nr:hypothetical protein [Bacillota bacterium]